MLRMIDYIADYPIKYLTLYAFSTENWGRPNEEVHGLFDMLARFIGKHVRYVHEHNIRVRHLGRLEGLPDSLKTAMLEAIELTQHNTNLTLNVAFNYGGRAEIVDAVRQIVKDGISADAIDEETFDKYLYTAGTPPVDLLIRTGDEERFSNFLIWQTAYSEHFLSDALWPDFNRARLDEALLSFSRRKRRFGGL